METSLKLMIVAPALLFSLLACNKDNDEDYSDIPDEERITMTKEELDEIKNEEIKREDPSLPGSIIFTPNEVKGMKLFMKHCNKCHPGGEKGKGPALNDKNLPDMLVHFQVRLGGGKMPAFKKEQISKEELKQIILFVRLMRDTSK